MMPINNIAPGFSLNTTIKVGGKTYNKDYVTSVPQTVLEIHGER